MPTDPPKRGRRAGDPAKTKQAILDAALHTFASKGYAATSVRAIAHTAGVDAALITHHFGTKEQLFLAAHHVPGDPALLMAEAIRADPEHRGEALARAYLDRFLSDPRGVGISLIRSAATDPAASRLLREVLERGLTKHASALIGDIPEAPVRIAMISALLTGVVFHTRILSITPFDQLEAAELAQHVAPAVQALLDLT